MSPTPGNGAPSLPCCHIALLLRCSVPPSNFVLRTRGPAHYRHEVQGVRCYLKARPPHFCQEEVQPHILQAGFLPSGPPGESGAKHDAVCATWHALSGGVPGMCGVRISARRLRTYTHRRMYICMYVYTHKYIQTYIHSQTQRAISSVSSSARSSASLDEKPFPFCQVSSGVRCHRMARPPHSNNISYACLIYLPPRQSSR